MGSQGCNAIRAAPSRTSASRQRIPRCTRRRRAHRLMPMDPGKVECVNGHQLPDEFQYGPESREPCPSCGSTSRRFFAGAQLTATGDVRAVGQVLNVRWNVEAASRTSFRVKCARLERGSSSTCTRCLAGRRRRGRGRRRGTCRCYGDCRSSTRARVIHLIHRGHSESARLRASSRANPECHAGRNS